MADSTSDKLTVTFDELLTNFGKSAPVGDAQVNSVKTNRGSFVNINCTGDAFIGGKFRGPLRAYRGLILTDGSATHPAFIFEDDSDTGFYRSASGKITFVSNGQQVFEIGPSIVVDSPITTTSGNLVLNPAGPNIDLSGKTLINAGGITVTVGNPNDVIVNDSLGVLSGEAQLSTTRGGTGINSSASSGVAKVAAGTWSVAALTDADIGPLNALTVTELTTDSIVSAGDLTVTPAGGSVQYGTAILNQSPAVGSDSRTYTAKVTTTNATATTLFTLPTTAKNAYNIRGLVSLGDTTNGSNTATYNFIIKGKNLTSTAIVSNPAQVGRIADGNLTTTSIVSAVSGQDILVRVVGIAARTIQWAGRFDVLVQQF